MVVAPFYEALTLGETLRYLRTVAGAVDIPVMLYNLPPATGVNLDPDTVGALAREVENIQYIKDTSADMNQAGKLIHHHGDVVSTFVGWDSLMLAALTEGAAGVMSGVSNAIRTRWSPCTALYWPVIWRWPARSGRGSTRSWTR